MTIAPPGKSYAQKNPGFEGGVNAIWAFARLASG
jgi:hypothetical protein